MILYGELYTSYGNYIDLVESHTSEVRANRTPTAKQGDLVMPLSSTTKDAKIGKVSAVEVHFPVHIGMDALILTHAQNTHYLVHLLNSQWFEQRKMGCVTGTTIMHLSPKKLATLPIPLPPLDVQAEIARILDRFTALEAELEAELEARQKQYEYYRDRLLTFDKTRTDVEWKTLGEVAKLYGGLNGKRKQDFQNGNVQFITYKNVYDHIEVNPKELALVRVDENERQNAVRYGDVLITGSSETMEDVGMASAVTTHYERPIYLNSFSFGIRFFEGIPLTPEFAKYLFRSPVLRRQIVKTASGVTRFNISKSRFNLIHIPLPPLAEQERIARILDKFSTLTTSLTAGLPREIALRRRQYEYYREQLLSFE